jgi:hypothetical protein
MQRVRQTGGTAPAKIGGSRRPLLEPYADWQRATVCEKKGITLREIQTELAARGVVVKALSTIADIVDRDDDAGRPGAEIAARGVVGVEVAEHDAAAVKEHQQRKGAGAGGRVDA